MKENISIQETLPGITKLWEKTKGDKDIRIAVLDGPVDLKHGTLKNADIISLDNSDNKNVRSVHGTFVTSLIFSDHESEIMGVAPDCSGIVKSIYHEETNGELRSCTQADIEQGILAALEYGADIINISGGERLSDSESIIATLAKALEECERKGVLVVAATGNEGDSRIHVPANYPTVLAVGSINHNGKPSEFSNWSKITPQQGLVAPGEDIVGAIPGNANEKAIISGTSFSTALVSGVAALLASLQKQLGNEKNLLAVRQILLDSVNPCTTSDGIDCARVMSGRLNIGKAAEKILKQTPELHSSEDLLKNAIELKCSKTLPICGNKEIEPQNLTKINNSIMKNETEVMPASTDRSQVQTSGKKVIPAVSEQKAVVDQATPSVVSSSSVEVSSCMNPSQVFSSSIPGQGSQQQGQYNPMQNAGDYPTWQNCQLVNAIGQPAYDFAIENIYDLFRAEMETWYENIPEREGKNSLKLHFTSSPNDHKAMAAFLAYAKGKERPNIYLVSKLIWTLNIEGTPIYAITPDVVIFSEPIYSLLIDFLSDNVGMRLNKYIEYLEESEKIARGDMSEKDAKVRIEDVFVDNKNDDDVMRMALPGYISGQSKLLNGNYVQSVSPTAHGLRSWTVDALVGSFETETGEDGVKKAIKATEDSLEKAADPDVKRNVKNTLEKARAAKGNVEKYVKDPIADNAKILANKAIIDFNEAKGYAKRAMSLVKNPSDISGDYNAAKEATALADITGKYVEEILFHESRPHLISILNRLYVETLNKGQSAEERALNYAVYTIIELSEIVKEAAVDKLQFSYYKVVPSKVPRQNSIAREVQLTFFDPENTNRAATTYSFQIDVSGMIPVSIAKTQKWNSPVSVAAV